MGRTLRSHSSFQTRVILPEDTERSRITSSMEHRAPKEILSVRNSKVFQSSYLFLNVFSSIFPFHTWWEIFISLSIKHEEQYYLEVIIVVIFIIKLLTTSSLIHGLEKELLIHNYFVVDMWLRIKLLIHNYFVINT